MPQFDLSFYCSQIFWIIVCFMCVFAGIRFLVLPAYKKMLLSRINEFNHHLAEIQALQKEINRLKMQRVKHIERVESDVQKKFKTAHEDIRDKHKTLLLSMEKDYTYAIEKFDQNFKHQQEQMLEDLKPFIEESCQNIMEKFFESEAK